MEHGTIDSENSGAVIQATEVSIQAQNVAGRDVIYETTIVDPGRAFAKVSLEPYSHSHYQSPLFTGELREKLAKSHFLIISGSFGFDKDVFARHLAFCLSESGRAIQAKEWRPADETAPDIAKMLTEQQEPIVLILNQIAPKDIRHDPQAIVRIARQYGHYVIVTTNLTQANWGVHEELANQFWFEIPSSNLYDSEVLSGHLAALLEGCKGELQLETEPETFTPDTALTAVHTVRNLATKFQTPEQIHLFIDLLRHEQQKLNARILDGVVKKMSDTAESFAGKWFKSLSEAEKLLVIGVTLLDGVYEEQFFSIMQEVTDHFWQYRQPGLKGLDYEDLDFLLNFFKLEEQTGGQRIVRSKFPGQRYEILTGAWNSYRRHIQSALSLIVKAGQDSRAGKYGRSPMYKSRARRMALRYAIAELLSDVGLLALSMVEDNLLDFAATNDETLQRITAKAIARWRLFGKEDQLFGMLQKWQTDERIGDQVADAGEALQESAKGPVIVHIKSTVLMSLSYAAEYDTPNNLHESIVALLNELIAEKNTRLDTRLNKMLPGLIGSHFDQLHSILKESWMLYDGIEEGVIEGLLGLYLEDRNKAISFLDSCVSECLEEQSKLNRRRQPTYRDRLLICSLHAYHHLLSDLTKPEQDRFWNFLQELYQREQRFAVRELVINTICRFTACAYESASSTLKPIFRSATLSDKQTILRGFVEAYALERKGQSGTAYEVLVSGQMYPAYVNTSRPPTKLESVLYNWLESEDMFTRELALLAFVQISVDFDAIEKQSIPVLITKTERTPRKSSGPEIHDEAGRPAIQAAMDFGHVEITWIAKLWLWWWLLFEDATVKSRIKDLIGTYIRYHGWFDERTLVSLVTRLKGQGESWPNKVGQWLLRLFKRI